MYRWADLLCLNCPPTSLFEVWRDFFCLQAAFICIYIYPIGDGRITCKKNPRYLKGPSTLQVEAKSLHKRNKLSLNRKGMTAFAVFLLSFFAGIRRKAVSGVGCRSSPFNLEILSASRTGKALPRIRGIRTVLY